jgi:hypothetical protein
MVADRGLEPLPQPGCRKAPVGERLREYISKELEKKPHEGETPPLVIEEVVQSAGKAVAAMKAAMCRILLPTG